MIRKFKFNTTFDVMRSYVYQPAITCTARLVKLPNDGYKYQSDIALLFNEERLRKTLGLDTLKKWIEHFNLDGRTSGVDFSGMSDAQIMSTIKSRYIQAPSELKAWSSYLSTCAEELVEQYNSELDKIKNAEPEELATQHHQQQQQNSTASD